MTAPVQPQFKHLSDQWTVNRWLFWFNNWSDSKNIANLLMCFQIRLLLHIYQFLQKKTTLISIIVLLFLYHFWSFSNISMSFDQFPFHWFLFFLSKYPPIFLNISVKYKYRYIYVNWYFHPWSWGFFFYYYYLVLDEDFFTIEIIGLEK